MKSSYIISSEYNFKKNHDVYISEYHYSNCFVNPIQTGGELAKKMSNRLSYMYDHQILVISP